MHVRGFACLCPCMPFFIFPAGVKRHLVVLTAISLANGDDDYGHWPIVHLYNLLSEMSMQIYHVLFKKKIRFGSADNWI